MTDTDRRLIEELEEQGVLDRALIKRLEAHHVADQTTIVQLETALLNARRIGAAVGVIMVTMKVPEDEAFRLLANRASASGQKLSLVASDVLSTGSVDAYGAS